MNKPSPLGTFFILVFGTVFVLGLTWFNFRRDNYVANQRDENGVDITAPFYQDVESAGHGEQHGHEAAKPGEQEIHGGKTENPHSDKPLPESEQSGEQHEDESKHDQ